MGGVARGGGGREGSGQGLQRGYREGSGGRREKTGVSNLPCMQTHFLKMQQPRPITALGCIQIAFRAQ